MSMYLQLEHPRILAFMSLHLNSGPEKNTKIYSKNAHNKKMPTISIILKQVCQKPS